METMFVLRRAEGQKEKKKEVTVVKFIFLDDAVIY